VFPVIGLIALIGIVVGAARHRDDLPFAMTGLFFLTAFLSLGVMFWPYMIPYSITVASAAAPDASLRFLFYGAVVVLPVIAAYTIGVYWVFRGRFAQLGSENGRASAGTSSLRQAQPNARSIQGFVAIHLPWLLLKTSHCGDPPDQGRTLLP
jgi:cytochrome d ubiquinol oxidase subunit II